MAQVTVVMPAYNEAGAIGDTIRKIRTSFENTPITCGIIVVDDGSSDNTGEQAERAGATVLRHPRNIGYGNALLTGIANADSPIVAITDADGTYPVDELPSMVEEMNVRGLDMLVGARQGKFYHGSFIKRISRIAFKALAEFTVGQNIPDINSGLRVMRREMIMKFAPVLCGGFSFTTTITVIAMLTNYFVDYRPIKYHERVGSSHVRYFRDTLRTAQILIMAILMFNPIKLFLLASGFVGAFGLIAVVLSLFVPSLNLPILLASLFFLTAVIILSLGFIAEQRRAHMERISSSRNEVRFPGS
ncbi:MAG: glycosyltransferase family 2 protein [Proteobacteria bacterium]|nr:glycosyltransferase family 2 protein [Pseudomonadota bacterium]MBU0964837.1 glycosyltransferase family 2 protein [Pseudomonadota bacterium]